MRILFQAFGLIAAVFVGVASAGINWKAVWLEPVMPVILGVGEIRPYTIMGLNGADRKVNLTTSAGLRIASSDPAVVKVDQKTAAVIGGKPGHAELRISFGEATAIIQVFVNEQTAPERNRARKQAVNAL